MSNKQPTEKQQLQKAAKKLDVEFSERTTVAELKKAIAKAETTIKPNEGSTAEGNTTADAKDNSVAPATPKVQTRRTEGPIFVHLPNGERREYARHIQGPNYKILAKQLAENPKYKGAKLFDSNK